MGMIKMMMIMTLWGLQVTLLLLSTIIIHNINVLTSLPKIFYFELLENFELHCSKHLTLHFCHHCTFFKCDLAQQTTMHEETFILLHCTSAKKIDVLIFMNFYLSLFKHYNVYTLLYISKSKHSSFR